MEAYVDASTGAAYVYRVTDPFITLPELHSTLSGGFILLSWPPGVGLALWMSPTMAPGSWMKADGSEGSSSLSYPLTAFFKAGASVMARAERFLNVVRNHRRQSVK